MRRRPSESESSCSIARASAGASPGGTTTGDAVLVYPGSAGAQFRRYDGQAGCHRFGLNDAERFGAVKEGSKKMSAAR